MGLKYFFHHDLLMRQAEVFFLYSMLLRGFSQKPFFPSTRQVYIIEVRKLKSEEREEKFRPRVKKIAMIRGKKRDDTIEHLQNTLLVETQYL